MKEEDTTDLDDIIEDVNLEELVEAKKSCKEEDDCDDEDDSEDDEDLEEATDGDDKIETDAEFTSYAENLLKQAHGDDYDKDIADKTIAGILKKADGDYKAAIGMLSGGMKEACKKNESVDYVSDIAALVEEDQTLSEDFKDKAGIIFEAALTSRLREETEKLQEDFDNRIVEETEKIKETLAEKIDNYLTYAVESWVEDNKIAIESGLRTEVAENFIDALKNVFVEHYIEVPDTKKDLVAELENKLTIAEQALSATEEKANDLNEQVEQLVRETIIAEATESLADTQGARLKGLVQDIEFVSEETFRKKVLTIKECYFKNKSQEVIEEDDNSSYTKTEVIVEDNIENELSPSMQKYVNALNRISKSNTISGGR